MSERRRRDGRRLVALLALGLSLAAVRGQPSAATLLVRADRPTAIDAAELAADESLAGLDAASLTAALRAHPAAPGQVVAIDLTTNASRLLAPPESALVASLGRRDVGLIASPGRDLPLRQRMRIFRFGRPAGEVPLSPADLARLGVDPGELDYDPCDVCGAEQTCVYLGEAVWDCLCPDGYTVDGPVCLDVDECVEALDDCAEVGATCTNEPGTFACACDAGWTGDGTSCADVDECADGEGDCAADATCTNSAGGYSCTCDDGFEGDGRTCADVDECALGLDDCADGAPCLNAPGTFGCGECPAGFELAGDACADVDECADAVFPCALDAQCTNTNGGFECECLPGFEGDGTACADVDECARGLDDCEGVACFNTVGGFACAVCGDGLRVEGEGCDDGGDEAGDGCGADCVVEEGWACFEPQPDEPTVCSDSCGDGVPQAPEQCDDGEGNDDETPDACRTNCRLAYCGDGVVDGDEECDPAELGGSSCDARCVLVDGADVDGDHDDTGDAGEDAEAGGDVDRTGEDGCGCASAGGPSGLGEGFWALALALLAAARTSRRRWSREREGR